jgi:hypothetical protein
MPAHHIVNQREKLDRLSSADVLRSTQDRIIKWWEAAYRAAEALVLAGIGNMPPHLIAAE